MTTSPTATGARSAVPAMGLAQDAEVPAAVPTDVVWILNSVLFLVGGFLVFFMAAGFAMQRHQLALLLGQFAVEVA